MRIGARNRTNDEVLAKMKLLHDGGRRARYSGIGVRESKNARVRAYTGMITRRPRRASTRAMRYAGDVFAC